MLPALDGDRDAVPCREVAGERPGDPLGDARDAGDGEPRDEVPLLARRADHGEGHAVRRGGVQVQGEHRPAGSRENAVELVRQPEQARILRIGAAVGETRRGERLRVHRRFRSRCR